MERQAHGTPTSERVDEEHYRSNPVDYLIYLSHIATYDFARTLIDGGRVLDFGCGTGYGTLRVSSACTEIVGVDISAEAIAIASERYSADNLNFRRIARVQDAPVPFETSSFDAVLAFQVIEHVNEPWLYVTEIARLLRPGGVVIVSTPDRRTRLTRRQRPWNRFHVTEYDPRALRALFATDFEEIELFTMSVEREILDRELRRTRRVRWLTYPFTFPAAPEAWRQLGLRSIKAIEAILQRRGEPRANSAAFGFDESAIRIVHGMSPGLHTLAVARRH